MPYAPGVEDRRGLFMFSGISQAGQGLAQGLEAFGRMKEKREEEAQQLLDAAKAGDLWRKALGGDATAITGLTDKEWAAKDAATRARAPGAVAGANAVKSHMQQMAEAAARQKAAEEDRAALTKFASAYSQADPSALAGMVEPLLTGPVGQGMRGFTPDAMKRFAESAQPQNRMDYAMSAAPEAMVSPHGHNLMTALAQLGQGGDSAIPFATEVGGRKLIVNPKSGAFQDVTPDSKIPALALGEEFKVAGGGRFVGNGTGTPHFVADADRTKALTDQQSNALQYAERMGYNNAVITGLESAGFHPAAMSTKLANLGPNITKSDEFQQYNAAKKNWISAVLRKESGAAISKSEETGAETQYFPQMGDSPKVIAQKAGLRQLAEKNMRRAIGEIQTGKGAGAADAGAKPAARFDTEADALKSGAVVGDVIELYDPKTATYRKARLK